MKQAWYLGHRQDMVGERALLVGDPDRIERIADHLQSPSFLPVKRGLRTVTGRYDGKMVTAVSFGMGAPIATIVLEELADLGVERFMRIGTAMYFPPAQAGDFVLSREVLSFEGTSISYVADVNGQVADDNLNRIVSREVSKLGVNLRVGTFATFDAFYREMFPIDDRAAGRVVARSSELAKAGVIAADMETSALVNASYFLGVQFTSLCVATVDAATHEKLDGAVLADRERNMFEVALASIASR
jgi:uridine phosphorylase